MSDDDRRPPALTPARLRAMAEWFRHARRGANAGGEYDAESGE